MKVFHFDQSVHLGQSNRNLPAFTFDKNLIVVPVTTLLYPAFKNNDQTGNGLGWVGITRMYSSVGHWNFQNFQPELIVLINLNIFSPSRLEHFDAGTPDSAAFSISSGDSCSINGDDSEDFMYSVSNPPTPQLARRKHASEAESENTFVSGMSDQSNSSGITVMSDKQNMFINSTEAILGKVLFTQT